MPWLLVLGAVLVIAIIAWFLRVPATGASSVHEFTLVAGDGGSYPLARHRGEVVLLVNTASRCGFTPQYEGLQRLQERCGARGFTVLALPCNDFLFQEPGADAAIGAFCATRFGVTFPVLAKLHVRGRRIAPLYRYLTRESARPGMIRWNFTKFLIGRDGAVVERFSPRVRPEDPRVLEEIEAALSG
jgi:glutathione peroxidase